MHASMYACECACIHACVAGLHFDRHRHLKQLLTTNGCEPAGIIIPARLRVGG